MHAHSCQEYKLGSLSLLLLLSLSFVQLQIFIEMLRESYILNRALMHLSRIRLLKLVDCEIETWSKNAV